MNRKIDIFITGAQKCGTTSLLNYLGEHPQLNAQFKTEMSFFSKDDEYALGYENIVGNYFDLGHETTKKLVAKYATMTRSSKALKRLFEHNPECKLIFMIREPVARAYSSYAMEYRNGSEERNFDDLVSDILDSRDTWQYRVFLKLGIYIDHINEMTMLFPEKNVKLIVLEEFENDPLKVMHDLFEWLGVDKEYKPNIEKVHNQGGQPKSKIVSRLIHKMLREDSGIKKVAKKVLSEKVASQMGVFLRGLNKTKPVKKLEMSKETEEVLKAFYKPYNKELIRFVPDIEQIWSKSF
jgi:hypothetical protein